MSARKQIYTNIFSSEQIQGLPATVDSKEELCDIVTRIISHLTIVHAAVNYQLSDYAEYIPNLPTKLYNDTRVEEGEFSLYRLPNRFTSAVSCRVVDWKEGPASQARSLSKIEAAKFNVLGTFAPKSSHVQIFLKL